MQGSRALSACHCQGCGELAVALCFTTQQSGQALMHLRTSSTKYVVIQAAVAAAAAVKDAACLCCRRGLDAATGTGPSTPCVCALVLQRLQAVSGRPLRSRSSRLAACAQLQSELPQRGCPPAAREKVSPSHLHSCRAQKSSRSVGAKHLTEQATRVQQGSHHSNVGTQTWLG